MIELQLGAAELCECDLRYHTHQGHQQQADRKTEISACPTSIMDGERAGATGHGENGLQYQSALQQLPKCTVEKGVRYTQAARRYL
jgi:hypothetical protein